MSTMRKPQLWRGIALGPFFSALLTCGALAQSPDLIPFSLVAGMGNVVTSTFPNPTVPVSWAVTNAGTGPVNTGFWYDAVYFSTNATFDSHAVYLQNFFQNFVLAAGGVYRSTNNIT